MKKVLTTLLLMLAIGANAQINNLDEIEIQGKWDVYGFSGSFSNIPFEYRLGNTPKYLELKDGNYTHLYFPNNDWMFKGYWLSCAQTGKYILHLLPWNSESVVNFVVTKFDDNLLHLSTYDEKGWIELRKSDTDDIENVSVDTSKTNTKTYNLNGVEVNENAKGIVISKGKKQLK